MFPKSLDPNKKELTVKDFEPKTDALDPFFRILGGILVLAVMVPVLAVFVYAVSGSVAAAGISPMVAFFITMFIFCRHD